MSTQTTPEIPRPSADKEAHPLRNIIVGAIVGGIFVLATAIIPLTVGGQKEPVRPPVPCGSLTCTRPLRFTVSIPAAPHQGDNSVWLESGVVNADSQVGDVGLGKGPDGPELGRIRALKIATEVDMPGGISVQKCEAALLINPLLHPLRYLQVGDYLCVETYNRGIAFLRISHIRYGALTLQVSYWPPARS
jgi:hypothetical protein